MSNEEKRSHLAELIKLAKADDNIHPIEVAFIKKIAIKMGLSSDEFNEVVTNLEHIHFVAPKDDLQKLEQFSHKVILMMTDQDADAEEVAMCRELGAKLGLDSAKVDKVLAAIEAHAKNTVPIEELKAILEG